MKEVKKTTGLSGLSNCGNTCYLNTCLQILSHTEIFNSLLSKKQIIAKIKNTDDGFLLNEWIQLKNLLWSEECIVRPNRFVKVIQEVAKRKQNSTFIGFDQNDTSEFFLFLMDCFHKALSRSVIMDVRGTPKTPIDKLARECLNMMKMEYQNEYSELLNCIYGIVVWQNLKVDGHIITQKPEPFSTLDLPIDIKHKNIKLQDLVDKYMEAEEIDDWKDENGKYTKIKRQQRFWSLPSILIVNIKRYDNFGRKSHCFITDIDNIDMQKYSVGYDRNENQYELYGCAVHSGGSTHGGHYYAIIKCGSANKWYTFNDAHISEYKGTNMGTANCFFYRKK